MEALRLFFVKPSLYFKTIMCVPHLQDEVIDVTLCPGFTVRTLFYFLICGFALGFARDANA